MHYKAAMFRRPFVFPRSILLLLGVWLIFAANAEAKKKPPVRPVNLNTASAAELEQVPGIGPSTAGKIVQMRKSYGAFKSVDDLVALRGIGKKRLDKMRKYLTVGTAPKSTAPQKSAATKSSSVSNSKPAANAEHPSPKQT
jgi:competence protein ComEA